MNRTMLILPFLLTAVTLVRAQDAATLAKVEKARSEAPACRTAVLNSESLGSIPMQAFTYAELDKRANALSHCGFVFRIVGDTKMADRAGNESDRYDAIASEQMKKFLETRGLWQEFLRSDCRLLSQTCGKGR